MRGEVGERSRGGGAIWWAGLHQVGGLGAATMLRLARAFGSAEAALKASMEELMARGRLSEEQAAQAKRAGEMEAQLRERIRGWEEQGIELLPMEEPRYPAGLQDLRSPPPLLYLRGTLEPDDARAVAVVGTRQPSREGARLAGRMAREFAERGFTIVSGLARGIDTAGHRGALRAKEGRTIAVLGCGLLRLYPPENAVLARKIAERGCLMAEVPPEAEVDRRLLLARDRIQAALSRAVIVVQAHRECGSIVTARYGVRCGRLLFGVPWSRGPFAAGWERLREMGARPIDGQSDLEAVVEEIDAAAAGRKRHQLL